MDLTVPEAEIKRQFPKFPGLEQAVEVVVEAGQALYLPASWFHEVTSFGGGENCMHVAVNYWFHPPDRIHTLSGSMHSAQADALNTTDANAGGEDASPPRRGKRKKRQTSKPVASGQQACGGDVDHACSAGCFPYKTDFWPSMWNNRVDRCSWPQHLKVPFSGCQ